MIAPKLTIKKWKVKIPTLSGEMERIEELEEERLYYGGKPGSIRYLNFFGDIVFYM